MLSAVLGAAVAGCADDSIRGGTPGRLTTGDHPVPDVQVTVTRQGPGVRAGYAVTDSNGRFELIAADSSGPLVLPPGPYVITLENVGAPTELPREYSDAAASPLRVDWADQQQLDLQVPDLILR